MVTKIGLTGGIGSGKSVVSRLLRIMGIPVYDSDTEAKRIIATDHTVHRQLSELIGQDILRNGELNRSLLASYLFAKPNHAEGVNRIVHPRVKEDFIRWASSYEGEKTVVAMEAAILLEAGFKSEVDFVVMVYAPPEARIARAMKRDGLSREQVVARIDSQMCDELKRKQADFVITNDGETPLIPQVLELISLLSQNNHYLCSAKK